MGSSERAVETDVGGNHPAGRSRALLPRVQVFQGPILVLALPRQSVRVGAEQSRGEIQEAVADRVEVFVAVGQHARVPLLEVQQLRRPRRIVQQVELARHRIADPVVDSGPAQHRAEATVPQAADDLVLRVVVGDRGIFARVHLGEALHPLHQQVVVWGRVPHEQECPHPLSGVKPVRLRDEFAVIRPVAGQRRQFGAQFAVLLEMPLEPLLVEI